MWVPDLYAPSQEISKCTPPLSPALLISTVSKTATFDGLSSKYLQVLLHGYFFSRGYMGTPGQKRREVWYDDKTRERKYALIEEIIELSPAFKGSSVHGIITAHIDRKTPFLVPVVSMDTNYGKRKHLWPCRHQTFTRISW